MYSTNQIAELTAAAPVTARLWAGANGVQFIGEGRRKTYLWTDDDLARFRARNTTRGRPQAD